MDYEKYLKYKIKYNNLKKTNLNIKGGSEPTLKKTLYLFKAEWCKHCKLFAPTWDKLKKKYHSMINFVTYDADKNKKEIQDAKIEGYPTLIFNVNNKATEYNGTRDIDSIRKFLDTQH